jgi:hypothetical protein
MEQPSPGQPREANDQHRDGNAFPTGRPLAISVRKRELGHGRIIPEVRSKNDK